MITIALRVDVAHDEGRIYATVHYGAAWTRYHILDGDGYVGDAAIGDDCDGEWPALLDREGERVAVKAFRSGPAGAVEWTVAIELSDDGAIVVAQAEGRAA